MKMSRHKLRLILLVGLLLLQASLTAGCINVYPQAPEEPSSVPSTPQSPPSEQIPPPVDGIPWDEACGVMIEVSRRLT